MLLPRMPTLHSAASALVQHSSATSGPHSTSAVDLLGSQITRLSFAPLTNLVTTTRQAECG
jgi:hypothetical protein